MVLAVRHLKPISKVLELLKIDAREFGIPAHLLMGVHQSKVEEVAAC
jgi:hypothetical protein